LSKPKPCPTCDGLRSANAHTCKECFDKGLGIVKSGNKLSSKAFEVEKIRWRRALKKYKEELDKKRD